MEGTKILKRPRLKNPYMIVAWPGMGEVAFKAATYLVDKLGAEEFAEILPEDYFYLTGITIQKGILDLPQLPYNKFYFWKNKTGKNDLIIFISSAQPDLAKAEEYSKNILQLAKSFKVKTIMSFAAMPQPIDHTQEPRVWFTATSADLNNSLKKYNLSLLSEGQISGMNGILLGIAKKEGLMGLCLLGEIPLYTIQIENPKASQAVLEALSRIFGLKIDFSGLVDQGHIMEGEINKLLDYLKLGPQAATPIGEEEIEKIKKSLSQLTRLPVSVKEKIEKLFEAASADIAKANELKSELDRWSAYKEYEDRFLDLFKKSKEKGN
ncbi:MAG: PAC2 family protein [Candidatus Omnitrophica bacterium]|nr:PAC2 family protein [Candidatus Omnitrophota bacterium]